MKFEVGEICEAKGETDGHPKGWSLCEIIERRDGGRLYMIYVFGWDGVWSAEERQLRKLPPLPPEEIEKLKEEPIYV